MSTDTKEPAKVKKIDAEAVETRLTRLEALMRKVLKNAEIHWGKDINGDGKVGSVCMKMLVGLLAIGMIVLPVLATDSSKSDSDSVRYGDSTDHYSVRLGSVGGAGYVVVSGAISAATVNASSTFSASGATSLGALTTTGTTSLGGTTVAVTNNMTVAGTAIITGKTTLNGGIGIGAQNGWTGVITNKMDNYTNLVWVGSGVITNVTLIGALP